MLDRAPVEVVVSDQPDIGVIGLNILDFIAPLARQLHSALRPPSAPPSIGSTACMPQSSASFAVKRAEQLWVERPDSSG